MERFNIIRNHVKFYSKFGVSATYTVPRSLLANSSLEQVVYTGLKEVLNHQPIMGVTVENEAGPEPEWVRLPDIDLREVVKFVDVDTKTSHDAWTQEALRAPFEVVEDLPLWRIVVAKDPEAETQECSTFTVGFFCHHAIADGVSAGAFQLTFLDALNALIGGKINASDLEKSAIVPVPKLPLVPNLEMQNSLPVGVFFALKKIINAFVWSSEDPLNWTGPLISADHPRPPICNLRNFSLPSNTVKTLLSRCRKENTSMTALLSVLIARKLALMYPTHSRFTGNIPFCLRKFTGHSSRDMGCYVSNLEPLFSSEKRPLRGYIPCRSNEKPETDDSVLWESARACKEVINERASTTSNQNVGLLKFISDYNKFFYGLFGTKRAHAFEVTNIGVLDGGVGQGTNAYFDRVQFSTAGCTFGNPFGFSIASAKGGLMNLSMNWTSEVVEDEMAIGLIDWLEGALRRLGETLMTEPEA